MKAKEMLLSLAAVLMLPVCALSADLGKSSSLTVRQDPLTGDIQTGGWSASCEVAISGVDRNQTYSGVITIALLSDEGNPRIGVSVPFQVDRTAMTFTQSNAFSTVTAQLKGRNVTVHADMLLLRPNLGDMVWCVAQIDLGALPVPTGTTLFVTDMLWTAETE